MDDFVFFKFLLYRQVLKFWFTFFENVRAINSVTWNGYLFSEEWLIQYNAYQSGYSGPKNPRLIQIKNHASLSTSTIPV